MKQIIQGSLLLCGILAANLGMSQDTNTVYFDFDRYDLSSKTNEVLEKISSKPNLYSIKIFGHTDQIGTDRYNDRLSMKRAQAVKDYFIGKGVPANSILVVEGFGEEQPAIPQLDETSRQANRRVVIITDFEMTAKDSVVIQENVAPANRTAIRKPVTQDLVKEITDTSTKAGDNLVLPNINFHGGRHIFLQEAYTALGQLLNAMRTIPSLEIEIQGHICCQEDNGDGMDIDTGQPILSQNRAKAVYDYLIENGIDAKRMTFKGFGHQSPIIAVEETEEERTTNRRVEIKILKK
jgi:outer membrane protein OmpA-like peptidoglycan-associated protein